MAIQAKYPSNVLLLNRNLQEGKSPLGNDFSMNPHQGTSGGGGGGGGGGGLFGDQTNMSFNYGVGANNSRKRMRETAAAAATLDSPLISTQQPQLINLRQLYTSQKNGVSTGLGLAFDDPHQQQQQQQQHSLSPQSSAHSSVLLSLLSDNLASPFKQQCDEIEHFLLAQGEQLRRTLAEKRQRHYHTLINAAEESAAKRMREKEVEVGKAARRNAELEAKAAQLSLESQAWQARARMQENYAATLQLQLQQAMVTAASGAEGGGGGGRGKGGAHVQQDGNGYGGGNNSTGMEGGGEAEDAESAYVDPDRVVVLSGPSCKSCRKRVASVVLLPCRHLCLCTECDAVAQACPACLSLRSSSIEVLFA